MIEVNLLGRKKPVRLPVVMGVDLNEVSFKGMIFAGIVYYFAPSIVAPQFEGGLKEIQAKVKKERDDVTRLQKEVKKYENIQEEVKLYNDQVEKLKLRSRQVDRIVKEKTNPKLLLEKVARSMPEEMWLKELIIFPDRKIQMTGEARSYLQIGQFLSEANNSNYFQGSLSLSESATAEVQESGQKVRIETYTIEGVIQSYSNIVN